MPGLRVCGSDPATAGVSDSKQALTYDAPKKEDAD